ncbi:hypothetical protein SAMN04489760_11466 [Syntrophus gentianae]|uniref:Calx-beta domain-containing protein n=1 Tax=Syntrophus gentianae TaxID=43775 RepID=A0A1H7Y8F3_9BACT|nr:choice-of-anchor Q domain-containing protein [Syntrophus gentianae]SEM41607.1 hypothetical protein SAMN04489760_11466 [Syntrophus gentianae]
MKACLMVVLAVLIFGIGPIDNLYSATAVADNDTVAGVCAEQDNVSVSYSSSHLTSFTIEASHPTYPVTVDNCKADFTNCSTPDPGYTFTPRTFKLFDNGLTVIEAVREASWWRPKGMAVSVDARSPVKNIHYIRVYKKISGSNEWPQVLVLYMDGNLRLIPQPSVGQSSVCFGSSIIVGPVVEESRPIAELVSVHFDSASDSLRVIYKSGGSATLLFPEVSRSATKVNVLVDYPIEKGPFATVRSMYVTVGNADVDSVQWKDSSGLHNAPILTFPGGKGTEWLFQRQSLSSHNTSAPDIRIKLPLKDTYTVCKTGCDYPSVQTAIDATKGGDTVLVSSGRYIENINFNGKAITVKSLSGPYDTVIDANFKGSAIVFNHGETSKSVLDGFTLTNGTGTLDNNGYRYGGGIYSSAPSPKIINCVLTGNSADGCGGGGLFHGSPLISRCLITKNHTGYGGGGLYLTGGSAKVDSSTISDNISAGDGGGIECTGYSAAVIYNSVLASNTAKKRGGGIAGDWRSSITILNSTIVNNSAWANNGPALFLWNSAVSVKNSILLGGVSLYSDATADINYSDVPGWTGGLGNISSDPLFINASYGVYHLKKTSPCVNAGDHDSSILLSARDADGNPRIQMKRVDMGAYEVCGASCPPTIAVRPTVPVATEAGKTAKIKGFRVNGDTVRSVTVPYAVSGTAERKVDYKITTASLKLLSGINSATVSILPIDDNLTEGAETVNLKFISGTNDFRLSMPVHTTVEIQDND